ncbi:MAG: hypothetical protein P8L18_08785 [Verrucomicrobiota bacterium]|nr:hypothetical protein [Verrucomicrobiota bacterium]
MTIAPRNQLWPLVGNWTHLLDACLSPEPVYLSFINPDVRLGRPLALPKLITDPSGLWAIDQEQRLMVDYPHWGQVFGILEREKGYLLVSNVDGQGNFGVHFTHPGQLAQLRLVLARFRGKAAENHSIKAPRTALRPPGKGSQARQKRQLFGHPELKFMPCLKTCHQLFDGVLKQGLKLSLLVGNAGTQGKALIRFTKIIQHQGTIVLHGHCGARVELRPSELGPAWLLKGRCASCNRMESSLEIYDRHGNLALSMRGVDHEQQLAWETLLVDSLVEQPPIP